MMKKYLAKFGIVFLICLFVTGSAHAWFFEADNLDNDLTVEIWFNPEGETLGVYNYQLDFGFDYEEIEYVSYTSTAPAGLMGGMFGTPFIKDDGVLWNFNASAFPFGTDGAVIDTRVQLGTLTFALLDPDTSIQDGQDDIWFDASSGNALITFSADKTNAAAVIGTGGSGLDISPVPVPAAVWLLGSGLLGLAGLRRKKS